MQASFLVQQKFVHYNKSCWISPLEGSLGALTDLYVGSWEPSQAYRPFPYRTWDFIFLFYFYGTSEQLYWFTMKKNGLAVRFYTFSCLLVGHFHCWCLAKITQKWTVLYFPYKVHQCSSYRYHQLHFVNVRHDTKGYNISTVWLYLETPQPWWPSNVQCPVISIRPVMLDKVSKFSAL
jgi:hypothetical protein